MRKSFDDDSILDRLCGDTFYVSHAELYRAFGENNRDPAVAVAG